MTDPKGKETQWRKLGNLRVQKCGGSVFYGPDFLEIEFYRPS